MREIKFRAWDGRKGVDKWYASYNDPFTWSLEGDWMGGKNPAYTDTMFPDGVILMQYTGLKDKNGVDIYEGDIVSDPLPNGDPWHSTVEYRTSDATYYPKGMEKYEVIGNIYENEDLLK